ncbi:hypothetical protein BUALT_Bualt02G0165700 [Buddleja alternifolia]|uniref:phosphopantothenoylcysteine decarboxylase n=1 Tax=Buddleja alternifolia TaxID=168488 RepID=A0AAV6Y1L4_9LAMI|nr:hypothetical protein BUALT_Bualt02G0165700 [Buddleja alternifolia]
MAQRGPSNSGKQPCQPIYVPRRPRILLAACGSMAAIGFTNLCGLFAEWAEVKAVATGAALHFIDRASLPNGVVLYTDGDEWSTWNRIGDPLLHVELKRWAEVMVIAPLSANTLGKIAMGLCDNLLTCLVRVWDCRSKPLFVAPDMNLVMWNSTLTERHAMELDEIGISLIRPVSRSSSDEDYGNGSMERPSRIMTIVRIFLASQPQPSGSHG